MQNELRSEDLRQAVAGAINEGEPVSAHAFEPCQQFTEGLEVAHFPGNNCAWVAAGSDAVCYDVPNDWDGSTFEAVAKLIETSDPVECGGLPVFADIEIEREDDREEGDPESVVCLRGPSLLGEAWRWGYCVRVLDCAEDWRALRGVVPPELLTNDLYARMCEEVGLPIGGAA